MNPYVMDTRPSNVPVYQFQHIREFQLLEQYTHTLGICQSLFSNSAYFSGHPGGELRRDAPDPQFFSDGG